MHKVLTSKRLRIFNKVFVVVGGLLTAVTVAAIQILKTPSQVLNDAGIFDGESASQISLIASSSFTAALLGIYFLTVAKEFTNLKEKHKAVVSFAYTIAIFCILVAVTVITIHPIILASSN